MTRLHLFNRGWIELPSTDTAEGSSIESVVKERVDPIDHTFVLQGIALIQKSIRERASQAGN